MKRIMSFMLCLVLLFCFSPMVALADTGGSGNIDGGGGGLGGGSDENYWNGGNDGVRVTVVNANTGSPATVSIDITNKTPTVQYHFGKISKIQYQNGTSLSLETNTYTYANPSIEMPKIVSADGSVNIDAIKAYFCDEIIVRYISQLTGIEYQSLISGEYKLFLEPIAYFTFQGQKVAMTATEAAMYDNLLSGGLGSKMGSLTHKNLPLSMFLETPDLGFTAYSGATGQNQSNDTIINCLGLGIVRFAGQPPTPAPETSYDYEYTVDTDVITPVTLYASGEINPNSPAKVTFRIKGSTYTVSNIVIPAGQSQLVWCKWHTPSSPEGITITVSSTKGTLSQTSILAKIIRLDENEPPNPTATDRNDGFTTVGIPSRAVKASASWGVWWAQWHPYWVWISHWVWVGGEYGSWYDFGRWEDHGWYDFLRDNYSASLSGSMSLLPDDKVPTASGSTMKSGYGVKTIVNAQFTTNAPSSHVTGGQTATAYFPEFHYKDYWRLLDRTANGYSAQFQFKTNRYSTYNRRVHFLPIWYPNGQYTVDTYIQDAWTPAGMLSISIRDDVSISGSLYDDWHLAPLNP
ncbi:hypothetical protein [Desulfosporosinus metallidurans]|uniref:Uncharacterized protein n=1 Tax=Desulfosporosinus metallidurans TaxID=1888891 RepID=A0A1Q8QNR7_9FIRM|nr:hypothetical protein [Desulfosporosinus metallidurans]OLN28989.1 hypothetical protein DSOL_3800 [Desulfosporosinus metallidurans]